MSTSQARKEEFPKQLPFASRKSMLVKPKFSFAHHVDVLGKYAKNIPKREISARDHTVQNDIQWYNDTRNFDAR